MFIRKRRNVLEGKVTEVCWQEWSVEAITDPNDRLIKIVSGDENRTVNFNEFTDWLASTDHVGVVSDGR